MNGNCSLFVRKLSSFIGFVNKNISRIMPKTSALSCSLLIYCKLQIKLICLKIIEQYI